MRRVIGSACVFGNALLGIGAALTIAGCGGSGGGGGGTAGGIAPAPSGALGQISGIAIIPDEDLQLAAPGSSSVGTEFQIAVDGYDIEGKGLDVTRDLNTLLVSDDESVVRVSGTGLLQPVGVGTAKIRASYGGMTAEKTVQVLASTAVPASPSLVSLKLYPPSRTLFDVAAAQGKTQDQQMIIVGIDAAGRAYDLTRSTPAQILDYKDTTLKPLPPSFAGQLNPSGVLRGLAEGEDVLVMVRIDQFGLVAGSHIRLGPGRSKPVSRNQLYSGAPLAGSQNPIDQAVLQGLSQSFVEPSGLSDDAEFVRRLHADAIGRLPTEAETEAFLSSTAPDKREREIDRLLATPEFAALWGARMGEWFTMNDTAFDGWARTQIEAGRALPQIVGDMARGVTQGGQLFDARHGSAADKVDILLLAGAGYTAKCAKCHDHPVTGPMDDPRWVQADRYPLDAFFAANRNEAIPLDRAGNRTGNGGQPFEPGFTALDPSRTVASTLQTPLAQRRDEFAGLFTASSAFKRGLAHRIWSELNQPLLDPNQFTARNLGSMRAPQVLSALTAAFEQAGGDLKQFVGLILKSRTYQLTSAAADTSADALLGRRLLRRMHSEPCESLVRNVTGANPSNLGFFRNAFGYPLDRGTIDERSTVVNLSQPLVLMNSPITQTGLAANNGRVNALATQVASNGLTREQAVTSLFRAALSRDPSPTEMADALGAISAAPTVRSGLEDVAAVLMATIEANSN